MLETVKGTRRNINLETYIYWPGDIGKDQCGRHQPLNWYNLERINNRTQRKFLFVDGAAGFTGAD